MDHQSLAVPDHLRSVELRHLRSFLVIAGSATMTEAAAALGISQPSISALLASLEEHLGVRLFDRDRNGVRITADGRRLRDLVLGPVVALNAVCRRSDPMTGPCVSVWPRIWDQGCVMLSRRLCWAGSPAAPSSGRSWRTTSGSRPSVCGR